MFSFVSTHTIDEQNQNINNENSDQKAKKEEQEKDETDVPVLGDPLPNTVETTLSIFPIASSEERRSRYVHKRKREEADPVQEKCVSDHKSTMMQQILFPTEEALLEHSIDRISITTKRRKTTGGGGGGSALLQLMNSRLSQTKDAKDTDRPLFTATTKLKTRRARNAKRFAKLLAVHQKGYTSIEMNGGHGEEVPLLPTPDSVYINIVKPGEDKADNYLPPNEFGVKLVHPFVLFEYQANTIRWMIEREDRNQTNEHFSQSSSGYLLAMVMGLGKTLCSATLVARTLALQRQERSCTLYVCPKNLLGTVRYEFDKFLGGQLKVLVFHRDFLRSAYDKCTTEDLQKFDVIITNYSTVVARMTSAGALDGGKATAEKKMKDVSESARQFCSFQWFRIILDESHEIRSKNTKRFKAIQALISPRRMCMTGTPIHNSLKDLFHQLEFCGFTPKRGLKCNKATLRALNLMSMIKFVEHKDAGSVKLPDKTVHKEFFDLSFEERFLHSHYVKNAQLAYTEISANEGRTKSKKTLEAHTSMLRVMQICSAPYLITAASKQELVSSEDMCSVAPECVFPTDNNINEWITVRDEEAGVQSSKMKAFAQLANSIGSSLPVQKTVVFANFTSTLRLAIDAVLLTDPNFKQKSVFVHGKITSGKKRDQLFNSFRTDPNVTFLFMTLKLGSVGLNLTEACNVIFLEPWYSYAALSQGEARVHRIGQVNPVNVYYLLGKDSVEERVFQIAMDKLEIANDIISEQDRKLGINDMKTILFEAF